MTRGPARVVDLGACLNFRDLGGYPTVDGRRVRWRHVFRSDTLHRLDRESAERLGSELGIRTAIDLRAHDEIGRSGVGHLRDVDVGYVHLPTADRALHAPADMPDHSAGTAADVYLSMLERSGERFAQALVLLSDPSTHPAVFFCSAGKDRTGMLAALLLGVLGVRDAAIVADYALTGEVVPGILERSRAEHPSSADVWARLPAELMGAPAHAMEAVIAGLRDEHGSFDVYVDSIGVDARARRSLRDALLEGAATK